jgi:hypothetical protein
MTPKAGPVIIRSLQLVSIAQFAKVLRESCEPRALHSPQKSSTASGKVRSNGSFRRRESQLTGPTGLCSRGLPCGVATAMTRIFSGL